MAPTRMKPVTVMMTEELRDRLIALRASGLGACSIARKGLEMYFSCRHKASLPDPGFGTEGIDRHRSVILVSTDQHRQLEALVADKHLKLSKSVMVRQAILFFLDKHESALMALSER